MTHDEIYAIRERWKDASIHEDVYALCDEVLRLMGVNERIGEVNMLLKGDIDELKECDQANAEILRSVRAENARLTAELEAAKQERDATSNPMAEYGRIGKYAISMQEEIDRMTSTLDDMRKRAEAAEDMIGRSCVWLELHGKDGIDNVIRVLSRIIDPDAEKAGVPEVQAKREE